MDSINIMCVGGCDGVVLLMIVVGMNETHQFNNKFNYHGLSFIISLLESHFFVGETFTINQTIQYNNRLVVNLFVLSVVC